MQQEQEPQVQMPIDRLSHSSLMLLLRNPMLFKLKHILGVYDDKTSVSAMVGRAGHKALQAYYGGNDEVIMGTDRAANIAAAVQVGLDYLTDYQDEYINYGKTGSREAMLATYAKAMKFYFAEEPEYNEILMVEEKIDSIIHTVDGAELPLPAVGVPDLVHKRKDGGIEIIDEKFVKSFTSYDTEDYVKVIQGMFLWHLLREKGILADRILFREIKTSENKDGGPQIRDYAIPFNHEQYRIIFYNLFNDAVRFLKNPNAIYLPNLNDAFDSDNHAGEIYAMGLISGDMSDVEVMHKVKDVAFTSKKFVPSRLDSDINKHLNPEEKIKLRLAEFGIPIEPEETVVGASITQYRFKVSAGISMGKFTKHKADIARAIEAKGEIRLLTPIPGTSLVGVEVPNDERGAVALDPKLFIKGTLSLPIGVDPTGKPHVAPLNEMPHLLIAGATGSGKSVLIHTILTALTKELPATQLQLILIDPKRVELAAWEGDRHLKGGKIAYEYADALLILKGLLDEMEARFKLLKSAKKRDVGAYNEHAEKKLPYIVAVVDEFADLIMQGKAAEKRRKGKQSLENIVTRAKVEQMAREFAKRGMTYKVPDLDEEMQSVEEMIVRLAQMARAVGIHLIIATQRPSVDVITGLIKANFPARIALTTASPTDSKVILGVDGAEKLTGKGDMLFMHPGAGIVRLQGFFTE